MAVHLSIGRIPSILLFALLGPAVAVGAVQYLSGSEPEIAELPPVADAVVAPAPEAEAEILVAAELEAAPVTDADRTAPARNVASVRQSQIEFATPPGAAPAPAAQERVTVARLTVEPQGSPAPHDPAVSTLRPKNMSPVPKRAPRAARSPASIAARNAATLFQSGAEIRVEKDASVYIGARNIPENDSLLAAYSAEAPKGGRVEARRGAATAMPGLPGIADQAQRNRRGSQANTAYSLAEAMRDAIWRKNTAARLKALTTSQSACAGGAGTKSPSIGLIATC